MLGSNLGDRLPILKEAKVNIAQRIGRITQESPYYETSPWGVLDQPVFVNQVIEMETDRSPEQVLKTILEIEIELGRVRYVRWGARTIDIDILYFADLIVNSPHLVIPHPSLQERRFTLEPLNDLIPNFLHPVLQKTTSQLLSECPDIGSVTPIS